ncbi:Myosin light chain kinase A [Diplonema papillatum]|nr:Myosin light chain kinase A [Diplonema papillatum]
MPPRKEDRLANKALFESQMKKKAVAYEMRPIVECEVEDRYKWGKKLCEGSFAQVYAARTIDTNEQRAIKVMPLPTAETPKTKVAWLAQEIEICRRVDHPNIVKLYEVVKTKDSFCMVFEVMNCDLWEFLRSLRKDNRWISEKHVAKTMQSLLEAVAYLHQHDIVHRDIKPENLLINKYGVVKLTDFGIAKVVNNMFTPFGSRSYMAPEIVSGMQQVHDMASDDIHKILMTKESAKQMDLWACGIVLYFLLIANFPTIIGKSREQLLPDARNWRQAIFEKHKEKWDRVDPNGKELVFKLLQLEALKRPTAADSLNHDFFNKLEGYQLGEYDYKQENDGINLDELKEAITKHVDIMRDSFDVDKTVSLADVDLGGSNEAAEQKGSD